MDITPRVNMLAARIHQLRDQRAERLVVALCGAPASGKSTLAREIARRLNSQKCPTAIMPMDGFHLDNAVLDDIGLRARKGAPETFDAHGFVHCIKRIKSGETVAVPVFDRGRDIAVAAASLVPGDIPVVLVEGNYLMFSEDPWARLAPLWDLSAWLDVPLPELRARLIQRWLTHGLSRAAATRRAESNDLPNASRIIENLLPCDVVVT